MTARHRTGLIYFIVIISTLLLRISVYEGVENNVGIKLDYYFTIMAQIVCFFLLPLILYFIFSTKDKNFTLSSLSDDFGFKKVGFCHLLLTLVICVCMIYLATILSIVWNAVLQLFGYTPSSSSTDYSSVGVLILELFMTAVLPGFCEEFTHRGLLFYGYRDSGFKVVFVSALLFALMHQNIRQTGYTFFDGVVIALLFYYTGSIWPGIIVHFINNAYAVLSGYFGTSTFISNFMTNHPVITIVLGSLFFIIASASMFFSFWKLRKDGVKKGIIKEKAFAPATELALPLHKDIYFIVTVILGVVATVFSFVWGIIR